MGLQQFSTCIELLLEVAQHLSNIEAEKSRRSSLRAMGLTCQTCFKPAMESLWKNVHGFGPILRCLPDDVWALEEDQVDKNGKLDWNSRVSNLSLFPSNLLWNKWPDARCRFPVAVFARKTSLALLAFTPLSSSRSILENGPRASLSST